MNYAHTAYSKNCVMVSCKEDDRIGLFRKTMLMLDNAVILNDFVHARKIVNTIKDYINVYSDRTDERMAVQLYRILDFIEIKLSEAHPNIGELHKLIQEIASL